MDSLWKILQWWALVQCATTGQLLGWHRLLEDSTLQKCRPHSQHSGFTMRSWSFKRCAKQCAKLVKQRKATWQTFPWALMFCTEMGFFGIRGFWNHRTSRSSCWFRPDVPPCRVMMLLILPHDSDQKPVSNTCFHVKFVNLRFINSWFFCHMNVNQRWKDSKIDQRSSLDCFAVEIASQSLHERPEICCGEFSLQPAENMVNRFCAAKKLEFVLAKIQHCVSLLMGKKYQNKTLIYVQPRLGPDKAL